MTTEKREITEKDKDVIDKWYDDNKMTLSDLSEFFRHLTEDYEHDYGTICHAVAAAAVQTARAVNRSPAAGITGFQAGAVMWEIVKHWMHEDGPMRLVRFENMLWPQYEKSFTEKIIGRSTFEWLQERAKKELAGGHITQANAAVVAHLRSIVDGKVPFDYVIDEEG